MPKRRAEAAAPCAVCHEATGMHVHSVRFPGGREVVGPRAIAEAVREWSRQPAVARVFGRLIAAAEAREREQMAVDVPEATPLRPERRVS